jgi:hypothetical protein
MDVFNAIGDPHKIVKPEKSLLVMGDIGGNPAAIISANYRSDVKQHCIKPR